MKERTLQILRYLTLPCLFSCLSLVADEQEEGCSKKKSSCEKPCESSCEENCGPKPPVRTFCQTYEMLKTKEVTPYAGTVVDGGVDASVKASYILWHSSQDGLAYAYYGVAPFTMATVTDYDESQGRLVAPQFKTNSGFKVGLGLDFAYDGWDLGLNYTWLHSHAKSSVAVRTASTTDEDDGIAGPLLPVHGAAFTAQTVGSIEDLMDATNAAGISLAKLDSASGSWRMHLNVLDLELGRNCFISSKLLVRPHYGLKGTWQKQHNNIEYVATGVGSDIVVSGVTVTRNDTGAVVTIGATPAIIELRSIQETYNIYGNQSYWGMGPRAGMNLSWLMSKSFSFFTDSAVSLLWGQFKNTRVDVTSATDSASAAAVFSNFEPINVRNRTHGVNAVVEMQLGLRYDYWFCGDDYRFRAQAGWENQLWFNQNHFLYVNETSVGDLSFQGFTLTFQFDF